MHIKTDNMHFKIDMNAKYFIFIYDRKGYRALLLMITSTFIINEYETILSVAGVTK